MTKKIPIPPVAAKQSHVVSVHGRKLNDYYHWLREKESGEVHAYLEAENAYTQAMMKPSEGLQKKLYREMLGRIKETDTEVPYKDGDFYYYSRTRKGQQYRIYCRKRENLSASEEVLLDLNTLAKGEAFLALGAFDVSRDGRMLAYSLDYSGFREYSLRFRDLESGRDFPETVEKVRSVAWSNDNRTLFYVTEDEAKRAHRVWRRAIGEPDEELVYEETDARFSVSVSDSRSREYIFVVSHSATTTEVYYVLADAPMRKLKLFQARRQDHEYYVDHGGNQFYVVTNDKGRNFRLAVAPLHATGQANWHELVAHRDDVMLDGVDVFSSTSVGAGFQGCAFAASLMQMRTRCCCPNRPALFGEGPTRSSTPLYSACVTNLMSRPTRCTTTT